MAQGLGRDYAVAARRAAQWTAPQRTGRGAYDLIRGFILKRASRGERVKVAVGPATPLVENELVDSFGILELIAYLEETFHIRISQKEITVDNFRTIDKILALVQSKKV